MNADRDFNTLSCIRCVKGNYRISKTNHDMVECTHCGFFAPRFSTKKYHLELVAIENDYKES